MTFRSFRLTSGIALAGIALAVAATRADATMGAEEMFKRLDADHDGTISRSEVVAAAERKYDLIASRNGGRVTLLDVGGRLSKKGVDSITKADESKGARTDPDTVSREQYIEQAEQAFDQAKFGKPGSNRSKNDSLTRGEMSAPSAKDLIDLVE